LSRIIRLNGESRLADDRSWGPATFAEIARVRGDGEGGPDALSPADMLAAARRDAQRIRDEAYKEGYDAGHTEAAEEVIGEANGLLDALKELNSELRAEQERLLSEAEPRLVELAVQIAEKILHHELTQDAGAVRATVAAALSKLTERDRVTIRANPSDVAIINEFKLDVAEAFDGVHEVSIVSDENIARGGCIVETDMLRVNGDIAAQLKQIEQQLTE